MKVQNRKMESKLLDRLRSRTFHKPIIFSTLPLDGRALKLVVVALGVTGVVTVGVICWNNRSGEKEDYKVCHL